MDKPTPPAYEAPAVTDHGSLTDLTAATVPSGIYDRSFNVGDPNPPGNLDSSAP